MKKLLYSAFLLISFTSLTQTYLQDSASPMKKSYSGDLSLNEVFADIFSNKNPDNEIVGITITIPMIKNSEFIVDAGDLYKSMPTDLSEEALNSNENKKGLSITVPYLFEKFATNEHSDDMYDFADYISESMSQWKVSESYTKSGGASCGGAPVGTIYSYSESGSCGLFVYSYECQMVGSQAKWIYTGMQYELYDHCQLNGPE